MEEEKVNDEVFIYQDPTQNQPIIRTYQPDTTDNVPDLENSHSENSS